MLDILVIIKGIWFFVVGACLGSFAGVVVTRQGKLFDGASRSHCDYCQSKLTWFDNLPIFSFFWLRGHCRFCHRKISRQYPVMEMIFGLIFVAIAWRVGFLTGLTNSQTLIYIIFQLTIAFILLTIAWWDWREMIIPDELVFSGWLLAFFWSSYQYFHSPRSLLDIHSPLTANFMGALLIGGLFYLLFSWSRGRWLGGGDVKLGFFLGFLVGWQNVYWLLVLAYILSALWALWLLARKKATRKTRIPFGPFLIAAYFLVFLLGDFWRVFF